ncbi:hypothetical protein D0T25_10455 [Duganella sp. BJB488]|uniref:hypothetical protein n=1 Tax=unclassified Duganella TaxID=2636909 RepID=UPI000E356944|nr:MULTISPECIES: hypothetical protein [unclassified Duganella]RFP21666.1 hypothetical protein D0T26_10495 [Duganella sp. BJB489]RFP23459.1 hypothetical protein D0T25_10455 [Duganella sp. BJB488]RFP38625.1 hypothetical protein D0T24_03300 [Duganella sp. BJB480]
MPNRFIAVAQFDGTVSLLKMDLSSGEREIVPLGAVAEDDVAFGLFEAERGKSGLESLALVATPDGPLLTYSGQLYYPKIDRTHIEIAGDGNYSHFRLLDGAAVVFELPYENKFGTGLHPYLRTRDDIDFYHWLGGRINSPEFYTAYTRNIRYIDDGGI